MQFFDSFSVPSNTFFSKSKNDLGIKSIKVITNYDSLAYFQILIELKPSSFRPLTDLSHCTKYIIYIYVVNYYILMIG